MPKKLRELKNLTIGQRQGLVLDAVSKNGLASISTVVDYVAQKSDIDITKKNVLQSFKKTIETDLKSFIGVNGKLDIKYYLRDSETEVSLEDVQENEDGSIKNIYNLKYYLKGSGTDVEGAKILEKLSAKFVPLNKNIILWKIGGLENFVNQNKWHCVLETNEAELISINCDTDSAPLNLVVGRFEESPNKIIETLNLGVRSSILSLNHQSVSRVKDGLESYHAKISINADYTITITDKSSAGTYICVATDTDCINLKKYKSPKNVTFMPKKDYPFIKNKDWDKIEDTLTINKAAVFLKFGEVVVFVGKIS